MASELKRTPEGALVIPAELQGKLRAIDVGALRLVNLHSDLLLSACTQPGDRPRPLLYGDLRLLHVGEIMALISSMRMHGTLSLEVPHANKTVMFSGGEIVSASSSVEDDRLGEVLWRKGYITLDQLYQVFDLVSPQKKLGAVLLDKKYINPRQLYDGIKEQILEIVYSTFHFRTGEFVFVEGEVALKSPVRLDLGTREVIMEGIRRLEEMTKMEELLPDRKAVLVRRPMGVETKLLENERHLLRLITGRRTVGQIIEESRLGEYDAMRGLAKLRRVGLVEVRDPIEAEKREDGSLPDVLNVYSQMLRHIHQTLMAEEPDYVARLEAYLGVPPSQHEAVFANVGFDADGKLDMDTLFRNARKVRGGGDPREVALEALRGFYDYAVFQAMDVLDDAAAERMKAKLDKLQSEISSLKG